MRNIRLVYLVVEVVTYNKLLLNNKNFKLIVKKKKKYIPIITVVPTSDAPLKFEPRRLPLATMMLHFLVNCQRYRPVLVPPLLKCKRTNQEREAYNFATYLNFINASVVHRY